MADFLTAQQVADLLQLHILTVYRLAESGELPAFKAGRQWRFAREAIEEWARGGRRPERQSVLVVDDDGAILRFFERVLRRAGLDVVCAENGEQALEACQDRDFDVVFLDLKLPGLDGVEVMRRLKQMGCDAHVVIMTGFPTNPLVGEAARLDPVTILNKPFDAQQVLRALGPIQATRPD